MNCVSQKLHQRELLIGKKNTREREIRKAMKNYFFRKGSLPLKLEK